MQISIASAQPIGTVIREGEHQPFKASACPIRALDYDESQMRDDDVIRRQQRSEVEYDCWNSLLSGRLAKNLDIARAFIS